MAVCTAVRTLEALTLIQATCPILSCGLFVPSTSYTLASPVCGFIACSRELSCRARLLTHQHRKRHIRRRPCTAPRKHCLLGKQSFLLHFALCPDWGFSRVTGGAPAAATSFRTALHLAIGGSTEACKRHPRSKEQYCTACYFTIHSGALYMIARDADTCPDELALPPMTRTDAQIQERQLSMSS